MLIVGAIAGATWTVPSAANAGELNTTIRVSLTILPTLDTRLSPQALPDGRIGFDNGYGSLDLSTVDFFVRTDGVDRQFHDALSAAAAIKAEHTKNGEPAQVTIVF